LIIYDEQQARNDLSDLPNQEICEDIAFSDRFSSEKLLSLQIQESFMLKLVKPPIN